MHMIQQFAGKLMNMESARKEIVEAGGGGDWILMV